jgi:serine/threonine-protein kinase RsbW
MQGGQRSFPREVGALADVFAFVGSVLESGGVEEPTPSTVSLIVEELFTNLVKYNRSTRDISIGIEGDEDRVTVRLTDYDVDPFDITRVPFDGPRFREDRAGGLGLHLVRRLAESVTYDYHDRESTITVVIRRGG